MPRALRHRTALYLWVCSALFIVYGTSIPFHFAWDAAHAARKLADLPLQLFISPETGRRVSIPDTVQNVLLFVPFGAFGMIAIGLRRHLGRRVVAVTILGAALSAAVETLQLFTLDRTSSLNDLATNTTGTVIGATMAPLGVGLLRTLLARLTAAGLANAPSLYPLLVVACTLPLAAWQPFDASLDVGTLWPKIKALLADPWQRGVVADEGLDFLRYALFGVAAASWLADAGVRRPRLMAGAAAAALAVAFESGQLLIQSRMPGMKDMVVHCAGGAAGALAARGLVHRWPPIVGLALVTVLCAAGAAMQMWSPFDWTATHRGFEWMPFLAYYQYTSVQTVSHVVELLFMFMPLGFVVAVAVPGARGAIAVAVTTLLFMVPLEYVQGSTRGRSPDVTDVAMALLGALAGVWLAGPGWKQFTAELSRRRALANERRRRRRRRSHDVAEPSEPPGQVPPPLHRPA